MATGAPAARSHFPSGSGSTGLSVAARGYSRDKGGHRIRDEDMARIGGNQQSTADRAAGARRLPLRLRDQPRRRHSTTLLVWTSSTSHEPAAG
jgi:hypothetical protein